MKKILDINYRRTLISIFTLCCLLSINSCKVTFIPDYDETIANQIESTTKQIDLFYLTMLETTSAENNGRSYNLFTEQYIEIEVELNSLLNKNKIRPLNENSTKICENALKLWQKYKKAHKEKNTIGDDDIVLNSKYMSSMLYSMQIAENVKPE